MGCHQLSEGWHRGMQAEILQLRLGGGLPAWTACPGVPEGGGQAMLQQRTPPGSSARGRLGACTGCVVQGISSARSHLQPSTAAPSCLPPLPPVARLVAPAAHGVPTSLAAGGQHPSPATRVPAWGPQERPAAVAVSPPFAQAPSCGAAAAGGDGKSRCLDAISRIPSLPAIFISFKADFGVSWRGGVGDAATSPDSSSAEPSPHRQLPVKPAVIPQPHGHCCPQGLGTAGDRDGEGWAAAPAVLLSYL